MPHLNLQSGVPTLLPNGATVGATDFREFSLGVGLPAGISEFGDAASRPDPNLVEIAHDEFGEVNEAGNHFAMTGRGGAVWGYGLDSFFGQIQRGEMRAVVRSDYIINSFSVGTAAGMVGADAASFRGWIGCQEKRVFPGPGTDSIGKTTFPGFGATLFQILFDSIQEPEIAGINFNIRIQKVEALANPLGDDWAVRTWYGSSPGSPPEPLLPDDTAPNQGTFVGGTGFDAIGWGQVPGFPANFTTQKIRFLSFSNNPLVEPAPHPFDIAEVSVWAPSNVPAGSVWTPS